MNKVKFNVAKAEQANCVILDGTTYDVIFTISEEEECYCEVSHPETKDCSYVEQNEYFDTIEYLKLVAF